MEPVTAEQLPDMKKKEIPADWVYCPRCLEKLKEDVKENWKPF